MSEEKQLLSKREFAKLVGCALSTVQRMCEAGKLHAEPDGSIDPAIAVSQFVEERAGSSSKERTETILAIKRAELREREARAARDELELRRERDELVEVAEAQADARAACEVIRTQLLALPARVALSVEALVAEKPEARAAQIEALIADEVNAVLGVLHSTKFGGQR